VRLWLEKTGTTRTAPLVGAGLGQASVRDAAAGEKGRGCHEVGDCDASAHTTCVPRKGKLRSKLVA